MKMGSVLNSYPRLRAPHSCSISQLNPVFPQFNSFLKTPSSSSLPLSSSSSTPVTLVPNRIPWCVVTAKKENPSSQSFLSPSIVEEVSEDDDFEEFDDDVHRIRAHNPIHSHQTYLLSFGRRVGPDTREIPSFRIRTPTASMEFGPLTLKGFEEGDDFEGNYFDEDAEPRAEDGGGGGGISFAGNAWDKDAFAIAEEVSLSFNGELGIYAFKTLQNSAIRVRIERLSNNSGSPTMEDIEAFSSAYRERLNEAEAAGSIPDDISLEVSSPGLERVVRIPHDLERFKDRPMYVKYMMGVHDATERDGVFRLESFDLETKCCTWGLADVRVNREKAGKGRPLSKKQKEWRLDTAFDSLLLVRIYADL